MNKDFKFNIKDRNAYLQINLKGDVLRDDACSFIKKAVELAEQKNVYKFLFNAKQATITGSQYSQQFFVLLDLNLIEYNRSYHAAILVNPDDKSHSFIVKVLKKHNHNVKLFTNAHKAKNWLLKKY